MNLSLMQKGATVMVAIETNWNQSMRQIQAKDPQVKEIDVARVINHLNHAFEEATTKMGKTISPFIGSQQNGQITKSSEFPRGNELYQLQVEFCYFVDEIARGAVYISPKTIAECNDFIAKIVESKKVASEAAVNS